MSHARDQLAALLPRVQVMELKFDDREPMRFDVTQEGTLKRISMALDIDLAAHEARIRAAKAEGWDRGQVDRARWEQDQRYYSEDEPQNPYREERR